ncbi:MAG: hypothetical protein FPO08_00485 [Geobacter sp.]|nr:MAG: hypothetical protein FPO08_00485 [Geobacter sp.]
MRKWVFILMLMVLPNVAFALEQSFTQQGVEATVKLVPDKIEQQTEVGVHIHLSKDGIPLIDRDVTLEVYDQASHQPVISRRVDVLDNEYVDSWTFDKPGDYRVVITIAEHQKPLEAIQYAAQVKVVDHDSQESDQSFFAHHFGDGHWGWWGAGLMLIMMPMMILL